MKIRLSSQPNHRNQPNHFSYPSRRPGRGVGPTKIQTILALLLFFPLGFYLVAKYRPHLLSRVAFLLPFSFLALVASFVFFELIPIEFNSDRQEAAWLKTVKTEEARDYSVYIDRTKLAKHQTLSFDCNLQQSPEQSPKQSPEQSPKQSLKQESQTEEELSLKTEADKYQNQSAIFSCQDRTITGKYLANPAIEPRAVGYGQKISASDGKFSVPLLAGSFTKKDWEKGDWQEESGQKDDLDFQKLADQGITKTIKLDVRNKTLHNATLASYTIDIKYNFTQSDIELLKSQHNAYKDYLRAEKELVQQQKSEELAEEQARKEAQELADQQAAAIQRAAQQAEANRIQQEQLAISNQALLQQPTPQPNPQPTPQSSTATTPTSTTQNNGLPLKARCKDGTFSYRSDISATDYRGVCSHHGGILDRLGRTP